jgi:Leucine-rich repeat (LRR) protein
MLGTTRQSVSDFFIIEPMQPLHVKACEPVVWSNPSVNEPEPNTIGSYNMEADSNRINLDDKNLVACLTIPSEHTRILNYQKNHIQFIEKLDHLKHLTLLDFTDNDLIDIRGLDSNTALRVLLLGKNRIQKIENIGHLAFLDYLDLHGNQISELGRMEALSNLRVLNLEGNNIEYVPDLSFLKCLIDLNLGRNKVFDMI